VFWVDKALDQHQSAPGVFLDIKGSFNFTSLDSIKTALVTCGVSSTTVQWIRATLEGHLATAAISDSPGRLQCPGVAHRKAYYHHSSDASSMIWYQGSMEVVYIIGVMPMMFICWQWRNSRMWCQRWYRGSFTLQKYGVMRVACRLILTRQTISHLREKENTILLWTQIFWSYPALLCVSQVSQGDSRFSTDLEGVCGNQGEECPQFPVGL
jgi:hypothetical protein